MLDEPHRAFYSLMINGVAFHYKSVLIRQPISGLKCLVNMASRDLGVISKRDNGVL